MSDRQHEDRGPSRDHDEGDRDTLRDLAEFGCMADRLVDRGKAAYDRDEILRLAAEAILHRIGEAVGRLSCEFRDAHPEMEWHKIRATRNSVAHVYNRVDHDIIWRGLVRRVPELTRFAERQLTD